MKVDRRKMLLGMAALAAPLPQRLWAQDAVLPLRTPGLDHLDVMVPDVQKTAKFYMGILDTELHAQAFRGGKRYFVLFNPLTESREVGYLAVGDSGGRPGYIGHFCTSIHDWRRDSAAIYAQMGEAIAAAGFGAFPGPSGFGTFEDPDGIEIQFLPAPDTLVTVAEPDDLVPWHRGLAKPQGVDSVLLRVSNLERAVTWYGLLYGKPTWNSARDTAYFDFPESQTRLELQQGRYEHGKPLGIAEFGIKVDSYDRREVNDAVQALGGEVLAEAGERGEVRIKDPDGNIVRLRSVG